MAIPLLNYTPVSQNVRVNGYEVPTEEQPKIYDAENLPAGGTWDELIWAAYRQIFSEHQILKSNRQKFLESQLKDGRLTVREFIRGLVLSDPFRRYNFETNSNYRFVEICVQRVLGRDVYSEREKIAWSIVIVNEGIQGFIDMLLNSDEYLENYGDTIVPYQRRRNLPQRATGETPFNLKTPRYGEYHRSILGFPQAVWQNQIRRYTPQEKQPKAGSPELYMNMARSVNAQPSNTGRVQTQTMNYMNMVPRRG
ncbi:phycobilisome rod-core linker polypeptide [Oscillatoriales cyanobacterium LEGE 11467]|uniref:Phycobilisome rod-core linker polypeptide n=1 Tax=Zarconia navalis LEGE 11467 TaxID=1828826 RepID=A0A928VXY0_9CYAN|nr:phycobilisome rod-core linker polypeptide [Zarconia navalis]MBE9041328.1 phycobilisome rod-core linker polypeptide [Zarconia navalis LEGE 11467]